MDFPFNTRSVARSRNWKIQGRRKSAVLAKERAEGIKKTR